MSPIRERTVEELEHGIRVSKDNLKKTRAGALLLENKDKGKVFTKLIEEIQETLRNLEKDLKRKGGG